jgi:hypothetical protein
MSTTVGLPLTLSNVTETDSPSLKCLNEARFLTGNAMAMADVPRFSIGSNQRGKGVEHRREGARPSQWQWRMPVLWSTWQPCLSVPPLWAFAVPTAANSANAMIAVASFFILSPVRMRVLYRLPDHSTWVLISHPPKR